MLSWKFWHKIAFPKILFYWNPCCNKGNWNLTLGWNKKIMLANTRNHDSHNMVLFQPLWHKGSLHLTLGWKKILLYSWRFPATKFFTCSRSVFSVSFCLGNLGTLTRGGEMGEFSPPFFWAPFFLFCFLSLKYWLVLIHYCKNSPPISKSWIRACLYLLR